MTAEDCACEFDPYRPEDFDAADFPDEPSWHYRRTCPLCSYVWYALHCPHDGAQNPCPNCGIRPSGRDPLEIAGYRAPDVLP